jgi:hypothetical protein
VERFSTGRLLKRQIVATRIRWSGVQIPAGRGDAAVTQSCLDKMDWTTSVQSMRSMGVTKPMTRHGFVDARWFVCHCWCCRGLQGIVAQIHWDTRTAPDIVGKDLQGKPVKLSDDRGHVIVLTVGHDFGKNDKAIERCSDLLEKHGNDPLTMVSVVDDQPDQPYFAHNKTRGAGITWKVIADPDGVQCARWCQNTSPEVYAIDAEGIIRFHGMCGEYSEDFAPLVEKLLTEATIAKRP